MKLSFAKKFSLLALAALLALASCLNPIGLPSYGSTQGSTGGGDIAPGEGRLIIKNLTRDFAINRVSFDPHSGQDNAPDLEPGPEKSNQRSVALPAGLWKVTAIYGPHGNATSINMVFFPLGLHRGERQGNLRALRRELGCSKRHQERRPALETKRIVVPRKGSKRQHRKHDFLAVRRVSRRVPRANSQKGILYRGAYP